MAKTRSRPRRARTIPPSTGTVAGGVHQKVVSERLGHARIGITLGTYSLLIPSQSRASRRRLPACSTRRQMLVFEAHLVVGPEYRLPASTLRLLWQH